jgi:hypothetical protein
MRLLRFALPAAALASLIVLTASDAPAGCTTGGVYAQPAPTGTLAANGRIVVEGSGIMNAPIAALDDTTLVLASDTEEIPLHVEAKNPGSWNVSQAILVPVREPPVGKRFALRASSTAKGSPLDQSITQNDRLWWTTTASLPADSLHWASKPTRGETSIGNGCPPHAYVGVHVPVDHPEQLLGILAEVRPLKQGGKSSRYLLPVYKDDNGKRGDIALGFQGCEEPIGLFAGITHMVKLSAVDLAGREIPAPGMVLTIAGPKQKP